MIMLLCFVGGVYSQPSSLFIDHLTSTEVRDKILGGMTTAIIFAGSTEHNGPHLVLGKHNVLSTYIAERIAKEVGNTLVYPILPFAPAGDPVLKTGHMKFPGSVSLGEDVFRALIRDVAVSAIAAGFNSILVMGDHGGGQEALKQIAATLDSQYSRAGIQIFYVSDVYYKSKEEMKAYLSTHSLPPDVHAGIDDTSELLYLDHGHDWVRREILGSSVRDDGIPGGAYRASEEIGKIFIEMKIINAVQQIRLLLKKR